MELNSCTEELKWTVGTAFTHEGRPNWVVGSIWKGGQREYIARRFCDEPGDPPLTFVRTEALGHEMVETPLTVFAPGQMR